MVIRGAKVIDGSGNPYFYADIGLAQDRIAAIAPSGHLSAAQVVNAQGLVLCPGFIDIQSHSIVPLLQDGRGLSKIAQGVTTEVMGEGWTPAPFGGLIESPFPQSWVGNGLEPQWIERAKNWRRFSDWLSYLEGRVAPNVGSFLAGGTLREYACGLRMGAASPLELQTMQQVMAQAMQDGAFGVAYALIYPPDEFVQTPEIIEVCKVAAQYGGLYITHMRSEGDGLLEGLQETLDIAQGAGIAAEIYHLKASGARNWGKIPEVLARVNEARQSGLDVAANMYPYVASGTGLDAILPPWVSAEGRFYSNLENSDTRAKVKAAVLQGQGDMNTSRAENIMPVGFRQAQNQGYIGLRLSQIAQQRGEDWVDCVINLLLSERQRISTLYFTMSEDNLRLQLQQPWVKFSSDAGGLNPHTATQPTHPRAYGTFPRVLAKYVRQEGLLSWEEAIRKMTWAVAARLGLWQRGRIAVGCYADLVLLNPQQVQDLATFEKPHQLATGIEQVWVNGQCVWREGQATGALPGRFVKGPGYKGVS